MALKFGTAGAIRTPPEASGVYGQGVTYPLTASGGRLQLSSGATLAGEAMLSMCSTEPGERVMEIDYGANVGLFEPFQDPGRFIVQLQNVVADHEPRIADVQVLTEMGPQQEQISGIEYTLRGEATPFTLTSPIFSGPSA